MACNSKVLSLVDEEKLSETVRNFPVLHDKSKKGYKERDAVQNAWTEVARSLDFIENWDDAKNLFENFKKRYLKKRNVQYTTFSSNFLGSSLLSVKTTRLKIYIVSTPAGLNSTDKRSRARAL